MISHFSSLSLQASSITLMDNTKEFFHMHQFVRGAHVLVALLWYTLLGREVRSVVSTQDVAIVIEQSTAPPLLALQRQLPLLALQHQLLDVRLRRRATSRIIRVHVVSKHHLQLLGAIIG